MKKGLSTLNILIIPIAVAINFVGSNIAVTLKLPMYLDAIGTIFGAILCGPLIGGIIGCITNLVTGITNPMSLAFMPTSIILGMLTGYLSKHKMFSNIFKICISVILMSLISIVISAPIIVYLYGGITASGASLVTAGLIATGKNIWTAVIGSDGLFNTIDRVISFIITMSIIKIIPDRTLIKFNLGENYVREFKNKEK